MNPARPRRTIGFAVLALCLAATLQLLNVALLGPLASTAAPGDAGAQTSSVPYTDVNPYGASTFLAKEVEDWKREKTVQMMADAGLGWMKQQFPWAEIEPKPGRFWDDKYNQNSWEKYDRIVALAEKHGLRVIARLDNTPEWAGGPRTDPNIATLPRNPDDYAAFVGTFVEHYRGRVQYLQIWNEPNLKNEWGGRLDAPGYVDLLCRAYKSAKAADPNVVILSAPLAQTLETGDQGLNELVYLQQLYDAGLGGCYDILLANGYGFDQRFDAPPDPRALNFRRVELLREVMVRNGEAAKPIWLNEYAWNAAPPRIEKVRWLRVTEEQQALWTAEGIRYARENWPWIGVINIWFFRQVGDISTEDAEYYFRMLDPEFTPTPLYKKIREATGEQRWAMPGRHGPLSPALVNHGRWTTVRSAQNGLLALRSTSPDDTLTIKFRGNQLLLEGERGPRGGRLGVTLDGSAAGLDQLPRDERGRRYIDFKDGAQTPATFPVVANLDPFQSASTHEHTAVLTVLPDPSGQDATEITLTGIQVAYERSRWPFATFSLVVAVLALAALALLFRGVARLRRGRAGGAA